MAIRSFKRQVEGIRKLLEILMQEDTRYVQLWKKSELTASPFKNLLTYSLNENLICRPSRGLYRITAKGRRFYESTNDDPRSV